MNIADLKSRRGVAQRERDEFQPLIDEAYDYAIPYRRSATTTPAGGGVSASRGEKRVDRVFDHTAIISAFRFAGKLQQDLVGGEFFKLEPGPLVTDADTRVAMATELEAASEVVGSFFLDPDWDQAFHEMALDLSAGTAAMLILPGKGDKLADFITVPLDQVLVASDAYGKIDGVFWGKRWTHRQIKEAWPNNLPDTFTRLDNKPEEEFTLNQDTVWNPAKKRWEMTVWIEGHEEHPIHEMSTRTCPWITPRYFRVSGETYGRGPVMLAMPTIKTLNTAQRLNLQAAAIAMLGIYTTIDDGVFNPDLSPLEPGAFWKVARNGGVLGPSVSRFPDPRLDLSQLVLQDMRTGVQAAMMDQSLPADGAAVRSATEILERVKRLASDHLGAFGRLVAEIIIPLIKRVIEIAWRKRVLKTNLSIDQLLIKVRVTSPLAIAREVERVQKILQWLQIVLSVMGERASRVVQLEPALVEIGKALGVAQKFMTTPKQLKELDDAEQAAVVEAKLAALSAGATAPAAKSAPPLVPPPEMGA